MVKKRFAALIPVDDPEKKFGPANKYDPEYCHTVRELAQKGMFVEEWCAHIGMTMSTLYNWANRHPEFEQAVHEAWWILRSYWTERARLSIQGVGMAPSILAMILERRFGDMWGRNSVNLHEHFSNRNSETDTITTISGETKAIKDLTDEELQAEIDKYLERRKHDKG